MRRSYIETSLGQIHCLEEGSGDVVLLIHQSGRSARMFREALGVLGEHFHAVALDLPGFGGSDRLPEGVSIEDLADLCAEVIAALGVPSAHVYGHHSGNKIATALAVRHPRRVRRLVLAGQSHSIIPDQQERNAAIDKFVRPYQRLAATADPAALAAEKWAMAYRAVADAWWRPGLAGSVAGKGERERARAIVLDTLQASDGSAGLYGANLAYDLGAGYRAVQAKTLVLEIATPEEDERIGRRGEDVRALIAGAELAVIQHEDGDGVTLEGRAEDLAAILVPFLKAGEA